jgi:hypothetical protein
LPAKPSPDAGPFRRMLSLVHDLARYPLGPQQEFGFKSLMHFNFYLMNAALVLLGLEVIYALYQLAKLVH